MPAAFSRHLLGPCPYEYVMGRARPGLAADLLVLVNLLPVGVCDAQTISSLYVAARHRSGLSCDDGNDMHALNRLRLR